jgi:hypothetical protein
MRLDIIFKDVTQDFIDELDRQIKELGLETRQDYIRLIVKLNASTEIINILKEKAGI